MKATLVWGTVLFFLVVAVLAFLVEPEDHGSNSAYGPSAGSSRTSAPVR